jgi:hypothetical protein
MKTILDRNEQQYIYVYVYKSNNDISKIISKRWKDLTARQEIYSGSATRTPSLPYSTPRAPNSRVFFTMSTSSLMAEKTLHTNYHTTTSSHLFHNFYTTTSQLLHNFFTPKHYLITLLLLHTYTTCTPQSIHNFSTYTPY